MLYINEAFAKANGSKAARAFDVLTVRTGANLGDTCVLPAKFDNCQTFTTLITTPQQTLLDPYFLCLHMSSFKGKKELARLQVGGGKQNLNTSNLKNYRVELPPLSEQRSISTALSDIDALLSELDNLIAKKRDLKQAAMQQLLTGKTRLPRFDGEWEVKQLGDLGHFLKGSGVRKDEAHSGDLPCIRYGEIYTHHHNCIKSFNSWISSEIAKTATLIKQGDILFAGSGETKEEIGKCV
ncbi:restriction endonuclease subunit S [Leptolyngbya sp. FACHB-17]|uniref:restriction endonuclease subunit S n=1 Tax=unclassified Leptolyngbya TaxID=2650499 RepID=UPI001681492C|nr:restriction endonuclease subunit S [Leptolyngbya sp. FACHB-17]